MNSNFLIENDQSIRYHHIVQKPTTVYLIGMEKWIILLSNRCCNYRTNIVLSNEYS